MDININIKLYTDSYEDSKPVCDPDGNELECSVEIRGIAPEACYETKQLDTIFLPAVGALCRYRGIKGTIMLMVFLELYVNGTSVPDVFQQRIELSTLKVLADRNCSNCGHDCIVTPFTGDECHWEPRRAFIEETDDEARCSNCGHLAYSDYKSCPNCCAVFRE